MLVDFLSLIRDDKILNVAYDYFVYIYNIDIDMTVCYALMRNSIILVFFDSIEGLTIYK